MSKARHQRQLCGAMAVRQEADVADAMEAVGQDVKKETAMNSWASSVITLGLP